MCDNDRERKVDDALYSIRIGANLRHHPGDVGNDILTLHGASDGSCDGFWALDDHDIAVMNDVLKHLCQFYREACAAVVDQRHQRLKPVFWVVTGRR